MAIIDPVVVVFEPISVHASDFMHLPMDILDLDSMFVSIVGLGSPPSVHIVCRC